MEYVIVTLRKISSLWFWLIGSIGCIVNLLIIPIACFANGEYLAMLWGPILGSIFFTLLNFIPRWIVGNIADGLEEAMEVREGKAQKKVIRHSHSHNHKHQTWTIVHKMDDGSSLYEEKR